ncbi:hypothetical protein ACFBZI_11400 [Moraxella sp. ZJ142]|uniref:hypothetical protein n=1 Tax=Moraxella marmotae TaxID=3344520 RepID=UPI0035D528D1
MNKFYTVLLLPFCLMQAQAQNIASVTKGPSNVSLEGIYTRAEGFLGKFLGAFALFAVLAGFVLVFYGLKNIYDLNLGAGQGKGTVGTSVIGVVIGFLIAGLGGYFLTVVGMVSL